MTGQALLTSNEKIMLNMNICLLIMWKEYFFINR